MINGIAFSFIEDWTFLDAVYFTMITLSTVGYGDFVPNTVAGRILSSFLIILGIFCVLYLLLYVVDFVTEVQTQMIQNTTNIQQFRKRLWGAQTMNKKVSPNNKSHKKVFPSWAPHLMLFLIWQITWIAFFMTVENMSFDQAFHFSIATASTGIYIYL